MEGHPIDQDAALESVTVPAVMDLCDGIGCEPVQVTPAILGVFHLHYQTGDVTPPGGQDYVAVAFAGLAPRLDVEQNIGYANGYHEGRASSNMGHDTIGFYDSDPEGYSDSTFGADTAHLRERFLSRVPKGGRILDMGCGSGRDSKAFHDAGYDVTPMDGSEGMCRTAERNTGLMVRHLLFSELDYEDEFDGIYACSSFLHVPSDGLPRVLSLVRRALRDDGVLYVSFKEGTFEGERDGRYYTDMTEGSLRDLAVSCGFEVDEIWVSVETGRDIRWVNALLVPDGITPSRTCPCT